MDAIAENKPYYGRTWRHILEGWLHWPEDRIARWLSAMDADLEGQGSGWFYHETATHYMIPLLIRDSLAERLQTHSRGEEHAADAIYFRRELFEAAGAGIHELDESYDWESARRRVEELLARHHESIPTAEEVTDYELRMLRRTA